MLKITYIAHSAFLLNDGKYTIAIDPFITNNPNAKININDIKADFIFLTHAHEDHFGDIIEIAKNNKSVVIAIYEIAVFLGSMGIETYAMNIGGECKFPFGKLKMTIAHHSAGSMNGKYMGSPVGAVIKIANKTIYYAGDTGLFLDMKLIGELSKPDIMILPIGGVYTMGIDDAVKAVEFVQPKIAIPMHFNTFDVIKVDINEFKNKIKNIEKEPIILEYGETINI